MDKALYISVLLLMLLFTVFGTAYATGRINDSPISLRGRRSDDSSPYAAVVNQHSQDLIELKAQVQALTARTSELENVIAFTVRFSKADITGLGHNQPVVFDVADYNAGGGYDTHTGIFTVPRSGTYVLCLSLQRHSSDETTIILAIKKGGVTLGVAEAGYSPYEHGSMVITTPLTQGEAISVQATHGTVVFGSLSTVFTGFRISL